MKLGDKVKFNKVLKRSKFRYKEVELNGEGIVVGVRTVQEGHWETEDYKSRSKYWVNDKSIPIVLVAVNLKSLEKVRKEDLIFE